MKMKCFHYRQSFALIIDVKFNFQHFASKKKYISFSLYYTVNFQSCFGVLAFATAELYACFVFDIFDDGSI